MLMPRKVRHRKVQRGRLQGMAKGGTKLAFGDYGIQALEPGWLTWIASVDDAPAMR